MAKKRPDVADIVLNGVPVHAAIIGDGWEQIDLFKEIEEYAQTHEFQIRTESEPVPGKPLRNDYVIGKSGRYDIVALKVHCPGVPAMMISHHYKMLVNDKEAKREHRHAGTIAHYMFDMLNQFKEKQN